MSDTVLIPRSVYLEALVHQPSPRKRALCIEVDDETAEKCRALSDRVRAALLAQDVPSLMALEAERHKLGDVFVGIVAAAAHTSEDTGK